MKSTKEELFESNIKLLAALDEIIEWKEACDLEIGGDPEGVTPKRCRRYWLTMEKNLNAEIARLKKKLHKAEVDLLLASQHHAKCTASVGCVQTDKKPDAPEQPHDPMDHWNPPKKKNHGSYT